MRVGGRVHNGHWNTCQPEYGTVTKINMDVKQHHVASHDVLMDSAKCMVTVNATHVKADVQHARTLSASPTRLGSGSAGVRTGAMEGSVEDTRSARECNGEEGTPQDRRDGRDGSRTKEDGSSGGTGSSSEESDASDESRSREGNGSSEGSDSSNGSTSPTENDAAKERASSQKSTASKASIFLESDSSSDESLSSEGSMSKERGR